MFWTDAPRDVVRVVGPDAATYLQSQVSNDLRSMAVGDSVWAFLLQPTGKVDVLMRVWRRGDDEFVLDTDAGSGEVMVARLQRFKIRVKADIEPLAWRCIALRGDDVVVPDGSVVAWGGGVDLLGPEVEPPAGAPAGSPDDLLAARIAAAWPSMVADGVGEITPGHSIPAETGITDVAVSFTKGCYPGQELVERMDSRGSSAPRLLQVVQVAEGTLPGQPYVLDGVEAGVVTSVSGTAALALVKRAALAALICDTSAMASTPSRTLTRQLDRMRAIALALPEATEEVTWGTDINFRVRKKIFAFPGDGGTLTVKADRDELPALLDDDRFSPAPYLARGGWVRMDLAVAAIDWAEIEELIHTSYCLIAPKKLAAQVTTRS